MTVVDLRGRGSHSAAPATLDARCEESLDVLASRDASRVPRPGLEYEIVRLDAEWVWVFGLIEEIDAGRLADAGRGLTLPDN